VRHCDSQDFLVSMGRPSYPVQREPVVIEITLRLRLAAIRVEITKVVVRAGKVPMWRYNCPSSWPAAWLIMLEKCRLFRTVWMGSDEDHLALHGTDETIGRLLPQKYPFEEPGIILVVHGI
jgi:hypothetical protein